MTGLETTGLVLGVVGAIGAAVQTYDIVEKRMSAQRQNNQTAAHVRGYKKSRGMGKIQKAVYWGTIYDFVDKLRSPPVLMGICAGLAVIAGLTLYLLG